MGNLSTKQVIPYPEVVPYQEPAPQPVSNEPTRISVRTKPVYLDKYCITQQEYDESSNKWIKYLHIRHIAEVYLSGSIIRGEVVPNLHENFVLSDYTKLSEIVNNVQTSFWVCTFTIYNYTRYIKIYKNVNHGNGINLLFGGFNSDESHTLVSMLLGLSIDESEEYVLK